MRPITLPTKPDYHLSKVELMKPNQISKNKSIYYKVE